MATRVKPNHSPGSLPGLPVTVVPGRRGGLAEEVAPGGVVALLEKATLGVPTAGAQRPHRRGGGTSEQRHPSSSLARTTALRHSSYFSGF